MEKSPFSSVVFAGGGCRCLWQAGFYDTAARELGIRPDSVAAVSAGSAISSILFSGTIAEGLELFKEATAKNEKNFYISGLVSKRRTFPHIDMYRGVILSAVNDAAFKKLKKGPELKILVARAPKFLGPVTSTFAGLIAYTVEKHLFNPVHPSAGSAIGFTGEAFSAQSCATPEELCDLICASSCTPPFVPLQRWGGKVALDGGLIDNVPVSALDIKPGERTLLLLTRSYPESRLPVTQGRVYVQPSRNVPVSKMDYTSPGGIQAAFDLGKKDAEDFLRRFAEENRRTRVR